MGKRKKRFHCPECNSTNLLFSTWIDEYGKIPKGMTIKQPLTYCIECDKRTEKAKFQKLSSKK